MEAFDGHATMYTAAALDALKALPLAPWRKFRGTGLDAIAMARMLKPYGIVPKLIRTNGKRANAKVARGFRKTDVAKAATQFAR